MSQVIRQPVANQVLKNRFLEDAAIALFNGGDEAVSIVAAQNGVALDSRLRQEIADHLQQSRQIHEDGVDSRKRAHHHHGVLRLQRINVMGALEHRRRIRPKTSCLDVASYLQGNTARQLQRQIERRLR